MMDLQGCLLWTAVPPGKRAADRERSAAAAEPARATRIDSSSTNESVHVRHDPPDDGPHYTRLRATISEQENFYCVQVQLSDDQGNVASGEEIADTIESASD